MSRLEFTQRCNNNKEGMVEAVAIKINAVAARIAAPIYLAPVADRHIRTAATADTSEMGRLARMNAA